MQDTEGPERRVSHTVLMVKNGRHSCLQETHGFLPGEMAPRAALFTYHANVYEKVSSLCYLLDITDEKSHL